VLQRLVEREGIGCLTVLGKAAWIEGIAVPHVQLNLGPGRDKTR
jgi:hypothetical protein